MEKILEQYDKVFDENGRVKFCPKEECIKLIKLCEDKFPNVSFGNKINGFLNVANIKKYLEK